MATSFHFGLGLSLVCLLLSCSCNALTSEEIFLQQYEAAFNASGIPYDEILVTDSLAAVAQGVDFTCPDLSKEFINTPATSVHSLTPYHIKVIGAVGDSVTAGFGAKAKSILGATTEYRGVSWSAGGDGDVSDWVTLPNIIKKFNPDVKGFSVGTGKVDSANANFNRAVSGSVSADIPRQVADLIGKIKADSNINIAEDWKLVTIWIGGNDLCAYCKDTTKYSPSNYAKNIKEALDLLKKELPRTFVNLVQILDVTKLADLKGLLCGLVHVFACDCGTNKKHEDVTSKASRDYNVELENMIKEGGYDSDDFAVTLQPFFKDVSLPKNEKGEGDKTFFALDCFHFSDKGHGVVARSLWNNMMEPVDNKYTSVDWYEDPVFKCPTQDFPYFYTHTNSRSVAGFGGVNPDPSSAADNSGTPNLLAILLGTGVAVYIAAMTIIIAIVAVVYTRRRRQRSTTSPGVSVRMSVDTENTRLIFKD